ncbi:unnamed protein product [Gadus morhua 'NCC']
MSALTSRRLQSCGASCRSRAPWHVVGPPGMTAPPPPACLALRLHTSEDPNGNAFASPDSPSSPSDRMLAVAVTTAAAAAAAAAAARGGRGAAGAWLDDASLSVYLDARSSARTWSDRNLNLLVAIAAETAPGPRSARQPRGRRPQHGEGRLPLA